MENNLILEADNVYKDYPLKRKGLFKKPEVVNAVRGISFSLFREESFGVGIFRSSRRVRLRQVNFIPVIDNAGRTYPWRSIVQWEKYP